MTKSNFTLQWLPNLWPSLLLLLLLLDTIVLHIAASGWRRAAPSCWSRKVHVKLFIQWFWIGKCECHLDEPASVMKLCISVRDVKCCVCFTVFMCCCSRSDNEWRSFVDTIIICILTMVEKQIAWCNRSMTHFEFVCCFFLFALVCIVLKMVGLQEWTCNLIYYSL